MVRRKYQWEILVDYLRANGGQATIRQIHMDCYLQNVPDAAMRARKHGINIETIKDPDNPKIASYKLHEKPPKVHYDESQHVPNRLQRKILDKVKSDQVRLFPTNQRYYE